MKTQVDKDFVRLNVNLSREIKDRFLAVAKANDTDGTKLIRQWIKEYLAKNSQTTIEY